jgi:predicted thioesterase
VSPKRRFEILLEIFDFASAGSIFEIVSQFRNFVRKNFVIKILVVSEGSTTPPKQFQRGVIDPAEFRI